MDWLSIFLTPERRRPIDAARAKAEADFRETLPDNVRSRSWEGLHSAVLTAMRVAFAAFHCQVLLAVQQDKLGVAHAREGARDFLDTQARLAYEWIVSALGDRQHYFAQCSYRFERYDSNAIFVFSRDMVATFEGSPEFIQFLKALSEPHRGGVAEGSRPVSKHVVQRRRGWVKAYRQKHDLQTTDTMARKVGINERTIQAIVKEDTKRFAIDARDKLLREIGRSVEEWYAEE